MTAPQDPPTPRRLVRSSSDRVFGGVSGGLGRYFGIDPLLVRVAFVVLAVAGGAGVLAYAALWLFVPTDAPDAQPPVSGRGAPVLAAVALVALAVIAFSGGPFPFMFGPGLLGLAFLGAAVALAVAAARSRDGDRDPLAAAALAAAAVVVAAVVAVAGAVVAAKGGGVAVAVLVVVAGVALVASAFRGGARWLILPALALGASTAFVAAAGIELDGSVGERSYRPASMAAMLDRYEHGMGEMVIDLRSVDFPPGEHEIEVDLGVGEAQVLVPDDVCVGVDARLGLGGVERFDDKGGGLDVDFEERPAAPAGVPTLLVDAEVGIGHLEVHRYAFDVDDHDGPGPGPGWPRRPGDVPGWEGDGCA